MKLLVIPENVVRSIATPELAFAAVRDALVSVASGSATILPVVLAPAGEPGAGFGIKSATHLDAGLLGLKVGSYFPGNEARGIPNHGSTTMLLDAETGLPRALVSAGYLNGLRTAAANAVAVDCLSRDDARVLGVIGAGHQAEFEVRAVAAVRRLERVKVWSRNADRAAAMCERLRDLPARVDVATERRGAVEGCDLVTTVTAASEAMVDASWVAPGTHVSAMGADAGGKQELDPQLMERASCFADLPEQAVRIGEFQHAVTRGLLASEDITPIGNVVRGAHPGRRDVGEITVFDSSGIATQDLHVAEAVVAAAIDAGVATEIEF